MRHLCAATAVSLFLIGGLCHAQPSSDPSTWIDWSKWKAEEYQPGTDYDAWLTRINIAWKKTPMHKYGWYDDFLARLERLGNGTFQYNGDIDLKSYEWSTKDLMEFWNDFHISVVKGWFTVANSNLISLRGCPKIVYQNFNCSNNQITTLVDGPHEVWGEYDCSNNQLQSLLGAPDTVRLSLNCSYNRIQSLRNGPSYIEEQLIIHHNLLTDLDGMPQMGECGLCNDMYSRDHDRQRKRPKVILAPYTGKDPTPDMVATTSMWSTDTIYCRSTAFGCFDATYNPTKFTDDELWATGEYEWGWLYFGEWKGEHRRYVKKTVVKQSKRATKSQTAR